MRSIFLASFLCCLSLFAAGQTYNYSSGTLSITVQAFNPCEGVAPNGDNGYLRFTVNSAGGGSALIVLVSGPGRYQNPNIEIVPVGSSYNFNPIIPDDGIGGPELPALSLPSGTYQFFVREQVGSSVINTFSGLPTQMPIVLKHITTPLSLTEDIRTDNTVCTNPVNGQVQASIVGGSQTIGTGSYTYTWSANNGLSGLPLTGTTNGTTPLNLATMLGVPGLPGGTYRLNVQDNYSVCSEFRDFTISDPALVVQTITTASPHPICAGDNINIMLSGSETGVQYTIIRNGTVTANAATGTGAAPFPITFPSAGFSGGDVITVRAVNGFCSPVMMTGAVTLNINPIPALTNVAIAPICAKQTSALMTYTGATGSPNRYSLDFDAAAEAVGFADLVNQVLPASPVSITVPATVPAGSYTAILKVSNSTTTCESPGQTVTIVVNALPTITLGTVQPVCITSTSATLPYSATTGSPSRYSITYAAAAITAGFANVTNAALAAAPGNITLVVPGSATAGTYNGSITVTNLTTGCVSDPLSFTVTIIALPTITFDPNVLACQGDATAPLTYTATTGTPDQYSIDFNAAAQAAGLADLTNTTLNASPIQISVPTGIAAGTYNGTLQVRNSTTGCVSTVANFTLTVRPRPTITLGTIAPTCFSATATSVQLPYTATTNSPTLYNIDFNAAANTAGFIDVTNTALPASPITIAIAANTPAGTYNGSLTVTNGTTTCASIVYPITIVIDALPTITLSTIQPVCIGSTTANIPYTSTTSAPNQYSLDFDAAANTVGFIDIANLTLPASPIAVTIPGTAGAGSYNATLTVRNTTMGCVSDPVNVTITIINIPTITLGANPQVCRGITSANLPYTATTGAPDQYSINFNPAANTAGFVDVANLALSATPIVITVPGAAAVGTYTGSLTVRNSVTGCVSATSTITVTIRPLPTITLSTIAPICAGTTTANLPYTATSGTPTQYSIDFNAAAEGQGFADVTNQALPASPIAITVPVGAAPGTYTATITVRNTTSTCVSAVQNISITIQALPTITLGTIQPVCIGSATASIPYTNTTGSPNRYTLDFDAAANTAGFTDVTAGTLPASPIAVTVPTTAGIGSYNATLTVTNTTTGCVSAPLNVTITIIDVPTITLGANPQVCFGATSAALPYTATTGVPNQYNIDFNAAANAAGFLDVANATLSATPIVIVVPGAAAVGTYTGSLTVLNSTTGCTSAPSTITVTIIPAPTIALGTIQPVCAGSTSASLPYTGITGTPDVYSIDFNAAAEGQGFADVTNVTLPASPITIAVPAGAVIGTYNATITVRNTGAGCVSAIQNISIIINAVPTIALNPNGLACEGDAAASLSYTSTTGAPNQYSIVFDAAANAAGLVNVANVTLPASAISVTLPAAIAAGTYNGVVTVRNSTTGCTSAPINITITVNSRPTITLGTIAPICASTTATTVSVPYTATTGAPTQYSITFSAAAISAGFTNVPNTALPASPIIIAVPANTPGGTYTATLSVRNLTTTCASTAQNISIVINSTVLITPGTVSPVCLGATSATLPYSGATGAPDRYTLDFNAAANTAGFLDVTDVALPAGSITIAIPTTATANTYTATLTVTNSTTTCPSAPMTVMVTISSAPSITLTTTNPSACVGTTSTTLPYTATTGSPNTYTLDFNGTANAAGFIDVVNAVLPASPITITVPASAPAGSYTATLTVSNGSPTCGTGTPQTITVSITPLPTITLGANPRPCIGAATADLPFTTTTGNPDLYSITFSAAAQAAGFVNVVDATLPATPGPIAIPIPTGAAANVTYTATLTVRSTGSGCKSTNRSFNIQMIDTPQITLGANPTVCRGTTTVNLPYSGATGSPNRYNIDFDAAAEAAGFADVTAATLAAARFVITVPGGAALGTYNGTVTIFRTGAEACPSTAYPFTIQIVDAPTLAVTTPTTVCLGATTASLSYVSAGAPATLYSVTFSAAAVTAGFTNVVDATLPAGGAPIQITIPATATATNYTATLSVKAGAGGCASPNRSFTIRINALPNVTLGTINPVCQGSASAILPYSGATGTPNRYSIDFDAAAEAQGFVDITDATLPVTQITIVVPTTAAAGTYNATATVKNATTGCASTVKNIQVRILEKPAITILANASVCVGGPTADLNFTATGSPDQYSIVFSAAAKAVGFTDIANATLTSPIVINVPATAGVGSYAATIVVRNSVASCVSSPPVPFNVDVITTPTVTVTTAPVICFGDATARISFTATGSPNQYTLDFDAAAQAAGFTDVTNGALTNPILVTVPAGVTMGSTYNAVLSVGNSVAGCASAGIPVTITVQPAVDIVSITDPITVCEGTTTATLTSNLNGSPDFYSIVFDAAAKTEGFVDVSNAPYNTNIAINIPTGANPAVYNAVVTFRNSTTTCSVDHALEVEILQTPIITPGPDPSACAGATSVNLTYTTNIPVQNYSINFDAAANTAGFTDIANVTIPASGPIVITVPTAAGVGIYNAIINVTTVNGTVSCTSPDSTFTIELTAQPAITLTDANPEVCPSATAVAQITYSGTTGSPDQYMLDFDAAAQTAGFTDLVYTSLPASPIGIAIPASAAAGTYNAILKVRRNAALCESIDYPVTITVLPQPSITVTTPDMDACVGDGSVNLLYSGTTGAPDTYTITFAAAAKLAGFTDILDAPLAGSPIVITYPTAVVAGNYAAQLIVYNSATPDKCTSKIVDLVIRIRPAATVDAGTPITICSNQNVTLAGVVGGGATGGTWSGGTGTFAPNNTTLNAVYTPSAAEITAGTVTLTLTTSGPCAVKTDVVTITINPAALVSAGPDQLICAGDTDVTLAGSFPANSSATSATWSGGTGTFAPNNQTLNAVYTLSAAEITAGGVTLTLTTTDPDGAGPCTAVSDAVAISISNGATVNASGPVDICANQVIPVTATFTGTTGVTWTTSGDGTFVDANLANAVYTPGAGDIAAGTVTLTATTAGPCAPVSDNVVVPIRPAATVNAGPDQIICSDVTDVNLTGTFGGSATGILWTTDGDGVFGNTTTPLTSYKIGLQDIARDSVVIYLNATGTCVLIDTMVVRINTAPIVDAGSPQTVCAGTNTQPLNGTFGGGASSASWTTLTGDGTFDDATKANAIYTPGPNDIAAGFADLIYITNDPVGPCDRASETIRITILNGLDATLAVSANPTPVCMNGSSDISVENPQLGVSYQLINADSNTPVGGVVTGTGPGTTILLPTGALTATTRFIVRASLTGCTTVDFPATPLDVVVQGVINTSFTVTASGPICETGTATIHLGGSENSVTYQLRRNADNSLVGAPVTGTGAPIDLSTGTLTQTTEFNVLASNATCSIELTQLATVTVEKNPDPNLNISVDNNPLCVGGSTDIYIFASQAGVSYQLRNDADNSNIGLPVTGNGGTITLNTGPLTAQTTVNILATSGTACPAVELFTVPVIDVKGVVDVTLPIAPADPVICEGGATTIEITGAETNVEYQLRLDADNSLVGTPRIGNGGVLSLPTGVLTATTTFNVLAKNTDPSAECSVQMNNVATVTVEPTVKNRTVSIAAPTPPICVGGRANIRVESSQAGISYQLRNDATDALVGAAVIGTGNDIILTTDALSATTTFNVFASGTQCPGLELTTKVTINVSGTINLALTATAVPVRICEGATSTVQLSGSQVGVSYQLQVGGTLVGSPVLGTGSPLGLVTPILTATTVYNVLANNGTCSALVTDTAVVRVNALPIMTVVTPSATAVCPGNSATVLVANSEAAVTYELRRLSDNALVDSRSGNGSNITLNIGTITATTNFVVIGIRTGTSCSRQLSTFTLTLRSASDPACGPVGPNCFVFTVSVDAALTKRPTCDDQADGVIVIHYSGDVSGRYGLSLAGATTGYLRQDSEFAGTITYTGLSPDDYKFTIADVAGNSCERSISLPLRPTVDAAVSNVIDAVCFGEETGKATFTLTGGNSPYEYSLDGGITWAGNFVSGNTIDVLPPNGTYNILFRNDASDVCVAEVSVTINAQRPQLQATYTVEPATCDDGGAVTNIAATGGAGSGYSYSMDGGSFQPGNSFTGLVGGTHTLTVSDGTCTRDFPVDVTFPGFVEFDVTVNDADCSNNGLSGHLDVSFPNLGGYEIGITKDAFVEPETYIPFTSSGPTDLPYKFENLIVGTYYIYVKTSEALCPTRQGPFIIGGAQAVSYEITTECHDNVVWLILKNPKGETGSFDIRIFRKFGSEVAYATMNSNGFTFDDPTKYPFIAIPDEYVIRVTQTNMTCGIMAAEEKDYVVHEQLFAQVGKRTESYPDIFNGTMEVVNFVGGEVPYEIQIELDSAAVPGQSYQTNWEPVELNSNQRHQKDYDHLPAGRYSVQVRDEGGCEIELIGRVPLDTDIYIPNIFTPNEDGINDLFFIRNLPADNGAKLVISDRWGKQVYSSNAYQNNWDAKDISDGIYFYRLKIGGGDPLTGWVEVLRGTKP
jgi:gliding motility-associated-like protein